MTSTREESSTTTGFYKNSASLYVMACSNLAGNPINSPFTSPLKQAAAEYHLDAFEQMLEKEKVEVLVVTTVDATHDQFIIPALKRGIKVLTEKPMTTDVEKSKAILRAVKETGNHLTVTFVSQPSDVMICLMRPVLIGS